MTGTLVPRYTFETLTLGPHYRFAHAADRAPRLLAGLDDSLRDRLERGLVAELANDTDGTA